MLIIKNFNQQYINTQEYYSDLIYLVFTSQTFHEGLKYSEKVSAGNAAQNRYQTP